MGKIVLSLPEALTAFVEEEAVARGYCSPTKYLHEVIQREYDRQHLRRCLLGGLASAPTVPADAAYFNELRDRARRGGTT
jgi:antitoxin ParD1/3/4